jgi:hypothetical protein
MNCIELLAETYPQLYLDPDKETREAYKDVVLRGKQPGSKDLSHFNMDQRDCIETVETPAGAVMVITLYDRHDFEVFMRCMMAAKEGPENEIPANMGASTIVTFNWPRINAHKEEFLREKREAGVLFPDWSAEFKRFRENKDNYLDMIIVLSRGPYSNVKAEEAAPVFGWTPDEAEWMDISDTIRKYHELTHFVCRKLFPEKTDAVRDELVADAAGIYAALGRYDRGLEELFLGIKDGSYTGGRIENYIEGDTDIDKLATEISRMLERFEKTAEQREYDDVFSFMLELEGLS